MDWPAPHEAPPPDGRPIPPDRLLTWLRALAHNPNATAADPSSIWSQLVQMAHVRHIYTRVFEIASNVPDMPPTVFFDHLGYTYVHTQGIAIRRQADERRGVVSLGRVLREVVDELELGSPGVVGSRSMTLETAQGLREQLRTAVRPIKRMVDQRIAHTDSRRVEDELLHVTPLHDAMDVLFLVFRRVEVFLTGATTPDLTPTIQYDWEAVFRRAWLPPR